MPISTAAIYSTLGNPNSLVPMAIKDVAATSGMTAGSYITGKEEGRDRLIDEVGTDLIWLLGIPTLKTVYDCTVFKAIGLDAKFDPRNLKDKEVLEKIKEYAPDETVKTNIEKIEKNQKLFKNTAMGRFIVSTALTIAAYIMLTKAKQKYTEKQIRQNLINEYNQNKGGNEGVNKEVNKGVNEVNNKSLENEKTELKEPVEKSSVKGDGLDNTSFKGIGNAVEFFAFSPVNNMLPLEGAITTTRLWDSRSPQEFVGYFIKELFAWVFFYFAGKQIQQAFEKHAKNKYNKSIDLDARVLEGADLKKSFENGSVEKSLEEFAAANTSNANLYEFLHKNPENMIVKTAKQSDIIKLYPKERKWYEIFKKKQYTDKIDTREYIDLKEIEGVNNKIKELYGQYKEALSKGETSETFFNGVRKLKHKSVIANIGCCVLALGIMSPGIMLAKRFLSHDDTEFQTKKDIREQLIKEGVIA